MELDLVQQRQQAHLLLDVLPEEKLFAVHNLSKFWSSRSPAPSPWAPVEDEELTPETMAALNRASASLDRGEGVSHKEMLREFGL